MKYMVFLLTLLSFNSIASNCKEYNSLSALQKNRLEFAYHQGVSDNKGYTLASIAYVESSAGKFRLNMESRDIGLFMINVKTAANTLGVTNPYKKKELYQKLIYDDILNAYLALSVLNYFEDYHKGDWRKMVASYNAGFNVNNGKKYLDKVSKTVKMLQQCMKIY